MTGSTSIKSRKRIVNRMDLFVAPLPIDLKGKQCSFVPFAVELVKRKLKLRLQIKD